VKILVVDDEPVALRLASTVLKRGGYEVLSASSAKAALELCERFKNEIALVLSDVGMPDMNGIELARCLSRYPTPIPVVMMSGYSPESVLLKGFYKNDRIENASFIAKPFLPKQLLKIVSTALGISAQANLPVFRDARLSR